VSPFLLPIPRVLPVFFIAACLMIFVAVKLSAEESTASEAAPPAKPLPIQMVPAETIEHSGLHNVARVSDWLYSGSSPESEVAMRVLKKLGIKTILSVDGARPEVELAESVGIRYVHLPIGYGIVQQERLDALAVAAEDLEKPIYVHCHHGKHRGPTSALIMFRSVDRTCSGPSASATIKLLGTGKQYAGLYQTVTEFSPNAIDAVAARAAGFQSVMPVPALVESMLQVDQLWEQLEHLLTSLDRHPKQETPEAQLTLLAEQFQESARLLTADTTQTELRRQLSSEAEFYSAWGAQWNPDTAPAMLKRSQERCAGCHRQFRDLK
jgi:protein tyrosine phosphatase (PTP) superfamily phosphohydrolase (DUF442 family)